MASVTRILSPSDWETRQIKNLEAVGRESYTVGIAHPKKDPIAEGIASEGAYNNAMKKVLSDQLRKKGLEKTNMGEWYAYASSLGADRLVEGVSKRRAKVGNFIKSWQPMLSDHVSKIDALPSDTDAAREKKVLENLRGLKALHGKAR